VTLAFAILAWYHAASDIIAATFGREVYFDNGGSCEVSVVYQNLPNSADPENFDWSAFPVNEEASTYVSWVGQVIDGTEPGRVVVGIDHAVQSRDDFDTFLTGTLVGLAGAALIGALQESLRLWAED
jgi:hypothetical protein